MKREQVRIMMQILQSFANCVPFGVKVEDKEE